MGIFDLSPSVRSESSGFSGGLMGFRWRFRLFVFICQSKGFTVTVTDGVRTPAEQNSLHRQNRSNPPYNPAAPNKHITGDAADINIEGNGYVLRKATSIATWRLSGVINILYFCGLGWGGDFLNYGPNGDTVHIFNK